MTWPIELALYVLLVAFAVIALEVRDMIAAVVALTFFSLLVAVLFGLMGAPDVALTEAALGAGVVGVLLVGAISVMKGRSVD